MWSRIDIVPLIQGLVTRSLRHPSSRNICEAFGGWGGTFKGDSEQRVCEVEDRYGVWDFNPSAGVVVGAIVSIEGDGENHPRMSSGSCLNWR